MTLAEGRPLPLEPTVYWWAFTVHGIVNFIVLPLSLWLGSPYGKLQDTFRLRCGLWGCETKWHGQWGWVVMESMALVAYWLSAGWVNACTTLEGWLWTFHYVNRAWVYPWRCEGRKPMALYVILSALTFNAVNGYLNGRWLFWRDQKVPVNGLQTTQALGMSLFVVGFIINYWADMYLVRLRQSRYSTPVTMSSSYALRSRKRRQAVAARQPPTQTDCRQYIIPRSGLFELVSCPHYFGEVVEWCGFALVAQSPAAWLFVFATLANLLPRAMHTHWWYKRTFPEYPRKRKALIPFVL
ncbi:hypothetical protein IWQ62_000491 [Dispira parvispora]|uniref:3-oxo-5-alpha-steroid 4-dehydrogenase C-terminal domain-containing protein n=1 Tax=Dispira parvispora TaxID=1520584 RepID=A0A9W8B170_9FUNG|nr:hypothetical protein IWQ62_000491 [Dispira parvispora]